jgi:hypothetical protein
MWLIALFIGIVISTLPVMVGARIVGAGRKGFWACFGALVVSTLIYGLALRLLHGFGLLAIFAVGLGYMVVLDTTYWRGMAVALIYFLLVTLVFVGLAVTLFHGFGDLMHHIPVQLNDATQSV